MKPSIYKHIWYWKKRLGERRFQPCKILACGTLNNVLIEFTDGYKVVTDRRGLRKLDKFWR